VAVEKLLFRDFNKKAVRKLLNVRWPQTRKFTEITALVPFSTATPDFNSYAILPSA
jgi:hypothetical protein